MTRDENYPAALLKIIATALPKTVGTRSHSDSRSQKSLQTRNEFKTSVAITPYRNPATIEQGWSVRENYREFLGTPTFCAKARRAGVVLTN
jgi:hypothetical protein